MNRRLLLTFLVLLQALWLQAAVPPLPWLHVEGNKIKDPKGNTVILRGVAVQEISDNGSLPTGGLNTLIDSLTSLKDTTAGVPGWYPKVIRFTVQPPITDFNAYYTNTLKPAVDYATQKGLYVIIDNHFISDVQANVDYTNRFWTFVAPKFRDYPNVLFEVYNEPINTSMTWGTFKTYMQPWIDLIREHAPHNLILVGNPTWSQAVGGAGTSPLVGENLVYVAHIYPGHWLAKGGSWVKSQVELSAPHVPIFMTEWGFSMTASDSLLMGTVQNYGAPIMHWADSLGLSWTAWCADNDWQPTMFTSAWKLKTGNNEMGGFVKQKLYEKRNSDQPVFTYCVAPYIGLNQTLCSNVPVNIGTGLDPNGLTFRWYKDGVLIDTSTTPSIDGVKETGYYRVEVEVDSNQCIMSDSVALVDTLFNVNIGPNSVVTAANPVTLVAGNPADGYTYKWYKNDQLLADSTSNTLSVPASDTCGTKYKVEVSFTGCGMKSDTFRVLCKRGYWLGHPISIPGIVEAEFFDFQNVPGLAYYDTDAGNQGGAFRVNEAVDVEVCKDSTGGYDVGWTAGGEWMQYSIKVEETGNYDVTFRVASAMTTAKSLSMSLNGKVRANSGAIPSTGNWQKYINITVPNVPFAVTDTMMQLNITGGAFNINYVNVVKSVVSAVIPANGAAAAIQIYPNPTFDEVHFSGSRDSYNWQLFSTLGEQVLQGSGQKANISSLQRGQYFLVIDGVAYKILKW